jgi:glycosyltransferase involved in cell wall biosynthesis
MKPPIPLLLFSDAVSAPSGLARITRDLATRIHANLSDVFRLATIGYGGAGSSKFPWTQYGWTFNNEFIIHDLEEIWKDFAGDQCGIFMSVQDPSRMLWMAQPQTCTDKRVTRFLEKPRFEKWGYFPIDATGPNNKLSLMLGKCFLGYDRVLAYSEWARKIVENTIGAEQSSKRGLDQIPHGIDTSIFFPRPRARQRQMFGTMSVGKEVAIPDDELLIGIVATNQVRKDWGLGIATCAELAKSHKIRIWMNTDALDRHWSIPYLLSDFGLSQRNFISLSQLSDDTMARLYSACDVTLGIGLGEGFGYPIFESLACGTPCIHGNYGGAPEHMPKQMLIGNFDDDTPEPSPTRLEGVYGCVRPVFNAYQWAQAIKECSRKSLLQELNPTGESFLPAHLDWTNLWPRWEAWFRKGVK